MQHTSSDDLDKRIDDQSQEEEEEGAEWSRCKQSPASPVSLYHSQPIPLFDLSTRVGLCSLERIFEMSACHLQGFFTLAYHRCFTSASPSTESLKYINITDTHTCTNNNTCVHVWFGNQCTPFETLTHGGQRTQHIYARNGVTAGGEAWVGV